MPEEVRADLLLGRDTLSPGLVRAGKAASDASSNTRQLTRDLYELGRQRATPIVDLQDAAAEAKLTEVSDKLKELGAKVTNPEIDVNDKKALADVAAMRVKLDALGKKVSSPRITLEGLARAEAGVLALDAQLDRIDGRRVTATVDVHRSLLSRLGGGIGGAASGAVGAGGAIGTGFAGLAGGSTGIIAAILGGLALGPAAIPLGLGALTGGGAALGAFDVGKKANKQMQALAKALASAQTARAAAASPRTRQAAVQRIQDARAQMQSLRQQSGPELAIFGAFQDLGAAAKDVFAGSLKGTGAGFSGGGPGGTQNASFLTGLAGILKQLGGFIKSIGPQLGDMFRASLPFLQAFVKVMEQFTKAVLPSMTQSLKELAPDLPILIQGFKYLSEGIAGFIKNLGPGMRDSAVIFKGAMLVVKGFLQLAGAAASAFAKGIVNTGRAVRDFARAVPPFFDKMRHDIATIFDGVRHDIAHYWDVIYNDTIGVVVRLDKAILGEFARLPGQIARALLGLGSKLYSLGRTWLTDLWHGIQSVWHTVLSFFSNIPGDILHALGIHSPPDWAISAGKHIMEGLHIGVAGTFGKLASFFGSIGGKLGSGLKGAPEGIAAAMLPAYGWSPAQMAPLVALWNRESGWRWNATNPTSGAYGIPQALPADKMAAAGPDWRTNPATQIRWGLSYIKSRYGSPAAAWAHELAAGWYGSGLDAVVSSPTLIGVGERGPERVSVIPLSRGGGTQTIVLEVRSGGAPADALLAEFIRRYVRVRGGNVQTVFGRN